MAFSDRRYPEMYSIFAREQRGDWMLYGIEIPRDKVENAVLDIQSHMRADAPFYAHLYDDETVIVIFKARLFRASSHSSSWAEVKRFGKTLGIPADQLDFWPNRFQDEPHYFGKENYPGKPTT